MKYTIKAAAVATGVKETTIRTWERRYGVPSPGRSATGRRLYDEEDIAVIRRMAALIDAGVGASEAAEAARSEESLPQPSLLAPPVSEDPLVTAICDGSVEYNEGATVSAIRAAIARSGWAQALEEVLMPAMRMIGEMWADDRIVSANEHFTSEILKREMLIAAEGHSDDAETDVKIVLACPEGEQHDLGLLALNLLLRERRVRPLYLGADVPTPDLHKAMSMSTADAVCLTATSEAGLASLRRATRSLVKASAVRRLFVGGPALQHDKDKDGYHVERAVGILLPHSLGPAADVICSELEIV